jgi:predicted dehydrogenase
MKDEPLAVAVVGLGWWGRILSRLICEGSEKIRVVRVHDIDSHAAAEFAKTLGVPMCPKLEDILEDRSVGAVILATPHSVHEEQIAQVAAAGKHVFCEKPLGLTLASVLRSIEACRKSGVVLGIGHERRFETPLQDLRQLIRDGRLGIPLQIEANFSHDRFVGLRKDNWRLSSLEAPAAGLTGPGIHLLDLAISLLGPALQVNAHVSTLASDLPAGDTLGLLLRHRTGATSYISATLATPFISRFALYGSKGWVEIRDKSHVERPDGWWIQRQFQGQLLERTECPPMSAVIENLHAFADAIRGLAPYPIQAHEIASTAAAVEGVITSSREGGRTVEVPTTGH